MLFFFTPSESAKEQRIPRGIWVLGFVSLLMDLSSEMIHALLPLFMVKVLAIPVLAVGVIEGIAEGTAMISKLFSGVIADRFHRPKLLAVIGYGLSALSKPLFPFPFSTTGRYLDYGGATLLDTWLRTERYGGIECHWQLAAMR